MKFCRLLSGTGVLAAVFLASTAQAALTYVDAELDSAAGGFNTTEVGGAAHPFSDNVASGSDGLWRRRPLASNNTTLWESNGDGSGPPPNNIEDCPRLVTTISGLAPGSYNIYAYFVGNHPNMRIGASLTNPGAGTQLPIYTVGAATPAGDFVATQVTDADLANFTNTVVNDTGFGTNTLYQASLGTAIAVGGQIQVFIDDDTSAAVLAARTGDATNGNLWRTVYDGLGYEFIIPEPSSLLLFVLGGLAAAFTRRR
jgi:hypothetical protein